MGHIAHKGQSCDLGWSKSSWVHIKHRIRPMRQCFRYRSGGYSIVLLVDTYNLLLQSEVVPASVTGMDLVDLAQALESSRYLHRGVTLVCDGRISGSLAKHHARHGRNPRLRVVFSGSNRTADDIIEELVELSTFRRRITVVTNDMRLGQNVRRFGSHVETCAVFLRGLASDIEYAGARSKPKKPEVPLDTARTVSWLEFFGFSRDGTHPTITSMLRNATPQAESKPRKAPEKPFHEPSGPIADTRPSLVSDRVIDPDLVKLFNECGLAIDLDDPDLLQWLGSD